VRERRLQQVANRSFGPNPVSRDRRPDSKCAAIAGLPCGPANSHYAADCGHPGPGRTSAWTTGLSIAAVIATARVNASAPSMERRSHVCCTGNGIVLLPKAVIHAGLKEPAATRKPQIWFVLQPPWWRSILVDVMPLIVSDGSKHGTGSYHFVAF